jgi:hypothetical protein
MIRAQFEFLVSEGIQVVMRYVTGVATESVSQYDPSVRVQHTGNSSA